MLKDFRTFFFQLEKLALELEMMEEDLQNNEFSKLNLAQLLRDQKKLRDFRARFYSYRLLTYDTVTSYAERLRASDEFKHVESVKNLKLTEKWWETLKERFALSRSEIGTEGMDIQYIIKA